MEDMYNMKDTMRMHSNCPMMTCPMMVTQPSKQNCMYGESPIMGCQNMNMYGTVPSRNAIAKPYIFQTEMRPVPIEEIED